MKMLCFIDGEVFHGSQACIPADDLGLQRGYAVFDYARVYNGKIFHIHDHLSRLRKSAAGLHLKLKYSDEEIIASAMSLIEELGVDDPGLRFILTGGPAHAAKPLAAPRFIMIAEELPKYPPNLYERGASLVTYEFRRDLAPVKTTNYMNAFRLVPFKQRRKAFDILYCWNGKVLECPRDNFFVFRGDTLITPEDDVLHGITRSVVIRLAKPLFGVETRDLAIAELDVVDEAFITSTTKQMVPIVQVDERRFGDGRVGARTRALMEQFRGYIETY